VLKKANIQATSEDPHRHFIEADGAKQILLVALRLSSISVYQS
jgi:hypothetical protein